MLTKVFKTCTTVLGMGVLYLIALSVQTAHGQGAQMLIDDFSDAGLMSKLGTRWRGVSDQVMGGVSQATIAHETVDSRSCLRLSGDVRLDNNGGFIQAALALAPTDGLIDASEFAGIRLTVRGNGEQYSVHLRTPDNVRPWQSYRAHFNAEQEWRTLDIPFSQFTPYRLSAPLDVSRLRRIGLVAIGRAFRADLTVCELGFYR